MGAFLRDLRFGVRMLVKRPGLSLAIVATFGLGIGLTTTVFSIVETHLSPMPDQPTRMAGEPETTPSNFSG